MSTGGDGTRRREGSGRGGRGRASGPLPAQVSSVFPLGSLFCDIGRCDYLDGTSLSQVLDEGRTSQEGVLLLPKHMGAGACDGVLPLAACCILYQKHQSNVSGSDHWKIVLRKSHGQHRTAGGVSSPSSFCSPLLINSHSQRQLGE